MRTQFKITATAAALTFGLVACGTSSDPDNSVSGDAAKATEEGAPQESLSVAASPVPHADILAFIDENLAEEAGLQLDIQEFADYVLPNTAVDSGEIDANYFQHQAYLDDFNDKQGTSIVPVADVHLEPLGLYSSSIESVSDLSAGQTVAVPNDTTNGGRALKLLEDHGVIELAEGVGAEATLADIVEANGLEFQELEAATMPRALEDVDAAVINGNYALEVDLSPAEDALALEEADGNPYANFLAVKDGTQDDPRVRTLAELLNSDEVARFIEETYEGSVIPAF